MRLFVFVGFFLHFVCVWLIIFHFSGIKKITINTFIHHNRKKNDLCWYWKQGCIEDFSLKMEFCVQLLRIWRKRTVLDRVFCCFFESAWTILEYLPLCRLFFVAAYFLVDLVEIFWMLLNLFWSLLCFTVRHIPSAKLFSLTLNSGFFIIVVIIMIIITTITLPRSFKQRKLQLCQIPYPHSLFLFNLNFLSYLKTTQSC